MTTLTIGNLAKLTGTNTVTIRYYEKLKLISSSDRSTGGHRLYPENAANRLYFIRNAKAVGFTLEEIYELLTLQENKKASSKQIKNRVLEKLTVIREKLQSLQKIYQTLEKLAASCDGQGTICTCPILKALSSPLNDAAESLRHSDNATSTLKKKLKK